MQKPKRFIQVLCGYVMMSDEELGRDTFVKNKDDKLFVALPEVRGKKRKLVLDPEPIAHQRAIVCRGTTCHLAKATGAAEPDCVVKFTWTSDKRRPEADLLQLVRERGVKGIPMLVGHHHVSSVAKLREGLTFSKPYRFRTPHSAITTSQ